MKAVQTCTQVLLDAADLTPGDGVAALAIVSWGPVPMLAQHMRANLSTTKMDLDPRCQPFCTFKRGEQEIIPH